MRARLKLSEVKVNTCSVEGCAAKVFGYGFCNLHYRRWKNYGDPQTLKRIPNGLSIKWLNEVALHFEGNDCLVWPFHRNNYGRALMKFNLKQRPVCRIICEKIYGEPPTKDHLAIHSCGNGHMGCVNPSHLRWGTFAENSQDMIMHGTSTRGVKNTQSKLSESDVIEIRRLHDCHIHGKQIAKQFNVSQTTISFIVNKRSWSWLKTELA